MKPWQKWTYALALILQILSSRLAYSQADYNVELAQVETADYPTIRLYVSVRDAADQIVEGLTQDQFTITEDGAPVEITDFSAGNRAAIATVLTIDRSGSMNEAGKLDGAKRASATFMRFAARLRNPLGGATGQAACFNTC